VICPGFIADCLETLEEIALEGKADFLKAGGGEYRYIPALNDRPVWINAPWPTWHWRKWAAGSSRHTMPTWKKWRLNCNANGRRRWVPKIF
jgi:hypothetical protein